MITTGLVRNALAVALGLAVLGACSTTETAARSSDTSASSSPATSASAPSSSGTTGSAGRESSTAAPAAGTPFDPCSVGWSAFPAAVRPADPDARPAPYVPKAGEAYDTACRYDNSGAAAKDPKGKHFLTTIFWAKPDGPISADPDAAENQGAEAATFSDKKGVIRKGSDATTAEPKCGVLMDTASGIVGLSVINGKFPAVDTCTIARDLANAIGSKS